MKNKLELQQQNVQGYTTILRPGDRQESNLEQQPLEDIIFFLGTKDVDVSSASIKYGMPNHESKYTIRGKGYEMRFLDFTVPSDLLPLEKEWMEELFPHLSLTEELLLNSKVGIAGVCGYLRTKRGNNDHINWAFATIMEKYARALEPNGLQDRSSLNHDILGDVDHLLPWR